MCIIMAFRKGNIGILKNFLHSTEGLLSGMTPEARKRFTFHYRLRKYDNGRLAPENNNYITNLKEAYTF